jgi:hypothetical protein
VYRRSRHAHEAVAWIGDRVSDIVVLVEEVEAGSAASQHGLAAGHAVRGLNVEELSDRLDEVTSRQVEDLVAVQSAAHDLVVADQLKPTGPRAAGDGLPDDWVRLAESEEDDMRVTFVAQQHAALAERKAGLVPVAGIDDIPVETLPGNLERGGSGTPRNARITTAAWRSVRGPRAYGGRNVELQRRSGSGQPSPDDARWRTYRGQHALCLSSPPRRQIDGADGLLERHRCPLRPSEPVLRRVALSPSFAERSGRGRVPQGLMYPDQVLANDIQSKAD